MQSCHTGDGGWLKCRHFCTQKPSLTPLGFNGFCVENGAPKSTWWCSIETWLWRFWNNRTSWWIYTYVYIYICIWSKRACTKNRIGVQVFISQKDFRGTKVTMASHDLLSLIVNTTCFGTWISAAFFIGSVNHYSHKTKRRVYLSTFRVWYVYCNLPVSTKKECFLLANPSF